MKIGALHIITDKQLKRIIEESRKEGNRKKELSSKIMANMLYDNTMLKGKLGSKHG